MLKQLYRHNLEFQEQYLEYRESFPLVISFVPIEQVKVKIIISFIFLLYYYYHYQEHLHR